MAKETFYFSHDYNTRSDKKIKKLIAKHGFIGYGIYWAIVEDLYQNANALQTDYECIAYDYRSDEKTIKSIVNDFDLFQIEGDTFGSLSIQRRIDERDAKSQKARDSAFKRWNKETVNNANALQTDSECNAKKESKVKESIIKDIKEEKPKPFNAKAFLLSLEIEEQIVVDWLKVRNKLKASNTITAFNKIAKEIEKSKYSANDCIKKAVEKSWRGFESEWMDNAMKSKSTSHAITDHDQGNSILKKF